MMFTRLAVTTLTLLLTTLVSAGLVALAKDANREGSDSVVKAAALPATDFAAPVPKPHATKVVELRKERLKILQDLAGMTERAYRAGTVGLTQLLQAKQAVLKAELELCETGKDRLDVLEKMVAQAKEHEKLVLESIRGGAAPAVSGLEARLARIEAEITLERSKNDLVAPPR